MMPYDRPVRLKPISTGQSGPVASLREGQPSLGRTGAGASLESAKTLGHHWSEFAVSVGTPPGRRSSPIQDRLRPADGARQPLQRVLTALRRGFSPAASPSLTYIASRWGSSQSGKYFGPRDTWTRGRVEDQGENARQHAEKHGKEFNLSKDEYIKFAQEFTDSPPEGTEIIVDPRTENKHLFHKAAGVYGVADRHGTPRTVFKPKSRRYWETKERELRGK